MSGEEAGLRRSKRVRGQTAAKDAEAAVEAPPKKDRKTSGAKPQDKEVVEFKLGAEIPDVIVRNQDDEEVNLKEEAKNQSIVIFAYPRANTPGCTRQAKSYVSKYDDFVKLGAKIYGLSTDSPKANKGFHKKFNMQFDLLCDPEKKLLKQLNGLKGTGVTNRSQWVFVDGKLSGVTNAVKPDASVSNSMEGLKRGLGSKSKAGTKKEDEDESKEEESEEAKKEDDDDDAGEAKKEDDAEETKKEDDFDSEKNIDGENGEEKKEDVTKDADEKEESEDKEDSKENGDEK